ncbi:C-type lectin domain family 7 member A-like [Falco biarmicus]|uniref:C-type lectin domain family 7 member A n=1 Tax=Falco cherrug TaxID=345164 RepID=UPI000FFB4891|nr:C-type lectin domain family 7 member A [Falco cherrug]XP_037246565.1 C-type lectin domain family 7 member A-like [Falco rusticolus]XP_056197905.1 C-type lectin domain family 7 member A-like [Falco biarmicus]
MTSGEVTYADLRFITLEKSQDQELQTARAKDSPFPSSCWRLATVVLGVFCISSVAAVGVLAARRHKCIPCPENWLQHGENCYHFSKEWKTWQESKTRCSALDSRLLKIESKEELDFTMRSAELYGSDSFWIGLSRNGAEGPWLWEDGSAFSPDLFQIRASSSPFLDCVWLQRTNIDNAGCGEYKFYICEKVVDPAVVEQASYSRKH